MCELNIAARKFLFKKLPLGFSVGYIPKGPLGVNWRALWPVVDQVCKQERAIFLKIDPDEWEDEVLIVLNRWMDLSAILVPSSRDVRWWLIC